MGNKQAKDEKKNKSDLDHMHGNKKKDFTNLKSEQLIEKFHSVIKKKKEAFFSTNLKPRDFTQMMSQVKVGGL